MLAALETGSVQQAVASRLPGEVPEHPPPQGQDRRIQHVSRSQGQKTRRPHRRMPGRHKPVPGQPRRRSPLRTSPPPPMPRWSNKPSPPPKTVPASSRIAIATGLSNTEGAPTVTPLPARRAAEEYEALRDASAAFAASTGAAPAILQLNIGPSAAIPPARRLDRLVLRSRRLRRRWHARFRDHRRMPWPP